MPTVSARAPAKYLKITCMIFFLKMGMESPFFTPIKNIVFMMHTPTIRPMKAIRRRGMIVSANG